MAKVTNSIAKATNSIANGTNSIIAKVTNSIAKATNLIAKTCKIKYKAMHNLTLWCEVFKDQNIESLSMAGGVPPEPCFS